MSAGKLDRLVQFVYRDPEGVAGKSFNARCDFLPHIGDKVFPASGQERYTIVLEVRHRFEKAKPDDEEFRQVTTVILAER